MTKMDAGEVTSSPNWETLESFVRLEAQHFIQRVLE